MTEERIRAGIVLDMMVERSNKLPLITDDRYEGDLDIVLDSIAQSYRQGVKSVLDLMTIEEKVKLAARL